MRKTSRNYGYWIPRSRRPRFKYSDALRARVVFTYLLLKTGLTPKGLSEKIVEPMISGSRQDDRDSSGIVYKWKAGQTIGRKWQQRLEPFALGLTALSEHPVFYLLGNCPITMNAVEASLSRWKGDEYPYWVFEDDQQRIAECRWVETLLRDDTQPLVERGDLDGFTVILGLLRVAEAANDSHSHVRFSRELYRAFPAVGRIPWFKEHRLLLRYCVQQVHWRDNLSFNQWAVNWNLINSQIDAEVHETIRYRCPREPREGRFILPKDPVRAMLKWPPDNKLIDPGVELP